MIRKLNFTGRKKIPKSQIAIAVCPQEGKANSFTAEVRLEGLNLPPNADVYVEAYRGHSYMRFAYGTVSNPIIPEDRSLSDFNPGETPRFRVKVVDRSAGLGKIVASADKISPAPNRNCLLPVEYKDDLGDQIWRLETEDGPVLFLNNQIESIRQSARSGDSFLALVYPEIVRQVLTEILIYENHSDPDCDEEDWQSQWLKFARTFPGIDDPQSCSASLDDKKDWIEKVVNAFCRKWKVKAKFAQGSSEDAD